MDDDNHLFITSDALKDIYLHNVQLYLGTPLGMIGGDEFEELAVNRLDLLRIIERASIEGHEKYSIGWETYILENLRERQQKTFYKLYEKSAELDNPSETELKARRIDHISHFILRLIYSELRDLHKWFIDTETDWFYLRYQRQTVQGRKLFFKLNNLNYVPISNEEKLSLREFLGESVDNEEFYKINFKEALNLIAERKVFLYRGYAYVPGSNLVFCIMNRFKAYLKRVLMYASRSMIFLSEGQRILIEEVRKTLKKENLIDMNDRNTIDSNKGELKLSNLSKYAKNHFPLCMKHMYDNLKKDHHLKYNGRLQLGNFLKNIGLSMEDSLKFWQNEFTQDITTATFDKQYSYHIKHMYGKVGRMREYLPIKCQDIINQDVRPGEAHGCPFKLWDSSCLSRRLKGNRLTESNISSIIEEVNNGRFQSACTMYLQSLHGQKISETVKSPNEYFRESLGVSKEDNGDEWSSEEDEDFLKRINETMKVLS